MPFILYLCLFCLMKYLKQFRDHLLFMLVRIFPVLTFIIFLEYYVPSKIAKGNGQIKTCSYSDYPARGEVCEVEVRDWGECNRDQFFNYHKNSPCIFIKLNKIYGWTPEYYDDPNDLPKDMPQSLKDHIRSINNTKEVIHYLSFEKSTDNCI